MRLYEKLGFTAKASHPPDGWAVPGEIPMVWLPPWARLAGHA